MSTPQPVTIDVVGHVATITIDRPNARNAINAEVAQGLEGAIDRLEDDPSLRVAVLTSTPPVFCAGADLKEIAAGRRDKLRTERGGFAGFVARERSKPVVAAVDGAAFGGGAEICLACDLIVASQAASFALPEVKRGLVAAAGGLFRLPTRLPVAIALEMALTGDAIDAATAASLGMINRLVGPGQALSTALELAEHIARNAPLAVRSSRRVVLAAAQSHETRGWAMTADAMDEAMASQDRHEGVAAFIEKREPAWQGR